MTTTYHQQGRFHFAARPAQNNIEGYIGWCKRGPIVTDSAFDEPGEVNFTFAPSADEAIAELVREVRA